MPKEVNKNAKIASLPRSKKDVTDLLESKREVIEQISQEYRQLEYGDPKDFYELDIEKQTILLNWILRFFESRKTRMNKDTTIFSLCLLFGYFPESFLVTTGVMKGAFIVAGFWCDNVDKVEWEFNVSQESVNRIYRILNR